MPLLQARHLRLQRRLLLQHPLQGRLNPPLPSGHLGLCRSRLPLLRGEVRLLRRPLLAQLLLRLLNLPLQLLQLAPRGIRLRRRVVARLLQPPLLRQQLCFGILSLLDLQAVVRRAGRQRVDLVCQVQSCASGGRAADMAPALAWVLSRRSAACACSASATAAPAGPACCCARSRAAAARSRASASSSAALSSSSAAARALERLACRWAPSRSACTARRAVRAAGGV
jgi:hypothetical protein